MRRFEAHYVSGTPPISNGVLWFLSIFLAVLQLRAPPKIPSFFHTKQNISLSEMIVNWSISVQRFTADYIAGAVLKRKKLAPNTYMFNCARVYRSKIHFSQSMLTLRVIVCVIVVIFLYAEKDSE